MLNFSKWTSGWNQDRTRRISTLCALLVAGLGTSIAHGQIATSLVNEGDEVDSNGFPGDVVGAINYVAVNSIGGWATTLSAGSVSHIYGSVDGVTPAGIIFSETTEGPLVQNSLESRFGFSDFSDVCYSASGTGGPDGGFDSVWVNTIGFAVEGFEITTGPLAGKFWSFASAPTMDANGVGYFSGGTRDTPTSPPTTLARGLWATTSETPIFYTGDEVPGLPAPLANESLDFGYKFSRFGSAYILDAIMETSGTDITTSTDHALTLNGAGLFLDGQLVQEGSVVPVAIGGDGTETWEAGFDWFGLSDMGEYMFGGNTSAVSATDEYLVLNGVIHLREGDTLGADTISGAIEAGDMNNNGDWAVVWQVSAGGTALIYNDQVLLVVGDLVDFNGDGVIDGADGGATVGDFTVFTNALAVGDRDAAGNVSIYVPLDVDPDGPPGSTSTFVEGVYRLTVTEPAGAAGDLELVVVDTPDPQVTVPGDVTYLVKVRNNSPATINDVVVTSTLDGGLTFDAGASDAIAVHAGGTVTANLGTIDANSVKTYKFVTNAATAGIYTTTSSVTSSTVDSVPGNNDVSNETEVGKKTDLSIAISDTPDPLTVPGGEITYTVDVLNSGPSGATGIVATINLDPSTTFNAGLSDPAANHAAGVVTINVGSLANDVSASYDIVVNVSLQGVINADASVTGNESDEFLDNNTAATDTLFQLMTDLVMTISDAPDPVLPVGGQITYDVSVDNNGPSDATGVTASVTLDDSVSVVSVDLPGIHDGSPFGGVVTYNIGAVPASSNGLTASIVVDTTEAGRPVCVGTTAGGGFETDPDLSNNTALVNTLVIDDAKGMSVGVFSNFASSPTSDVPGLPGIKFGSGVDRPYRSPDGSTWVLTATTDLGSAVDEVIIVGDHCSSGVQIQEGVTTLDQSDQVGPIDTELSINDNGQFAFATNTNNSTSADEVIVRSDGSTHVAIAREGNLSPATSGNFGATLAAPNIVSDNTVWFDADTTLTSSMDRFLLSKNGVIIEAQEAVTVPSGQAGGATDPYQSFSTGSMRVDATGSNFIVVADTSGPTTSDGILVVNNQVVVQEGEIVPGSGFASPAELSTSTEANMFANGSWMARGFNEDGNDWVLRDGTVVATSGDPIVAGAAESHSAVGSGFFLFAQNNAGDYILGSSTSATESASDAVLTLNGDVVIAREGDPVDLDGNGIVDDGMRIRTFGNDDLILTEDLQAYATVTVRDFNDGGSNTDIGDVFVRFNLCGLAGPCGDLDNDKDVDGDDYDIFVIAFGSSSCDAEYSICADFDEDGVVTHVDFQQWLLCYRDFVGNPLASPPITVMGDFDRDDDIDLSDFAQFQICAGEDSESVPCRARFDFNQDDVVTLLDAGGLAESLAGPENQ